MSALLAFLALLVEIVAGYPAQLDRAIGHPIAWIGRIIGFLEAGLNRPDRSFEARRFAGIAALAILLLVTGGIACAIERFFGFLLGPTVGLIATAIVASSLFAQRSLARHVEAVAEALERHGIEAARKAVSHIVGRDPNVLDEAAVARAAIESLAENFSDGVVAPAIWTTVGGLPGGAIYKAINTADSMIGHRSERYAAFGWASARLDDLVNLPASRLTALLIVAASCSIAGASPQNAWRAVRRDAPRHRSPNAGWSEAAMAGALGIAIAGPRRYGGVMVEDAYMGEGGRREVTAADIRRALQLYWRADLLLIVLVAATAGAVMLLS
jgi:adenosylcobinamide-phosphate synthase